MPNFGRLQRLIQGQGGSTLIETLVAMPLAIGLLFAVFEVFSSAASDHQRISARTTAVGDAQRGLERMTREVRQANWVHFVNSHVIELDAMARTGAGTTASSRHVRYDCSTTVCLRSEGPPVAYPPPASAAYDKTTVVVGAPASDPASLHGRLSGRNVFEPRRVDPQTGGSFRDYLNPDLLLIRLWLDVEGIRTPVEIVDGVSLRNNSRFR